MLFNYFKTTIRSLAKNRLFSLINILGLSVGLAAAVFILQYAFFELSYDQYNKNSDRVFRVMNERFEGDRMIQRGQITYSAVGPQMAADYPEVELHTTVSYFINMAFMFNEKPFVESLVPFVEPSFIEMFDLKVIAGDTKGLMDEPLEIIITESLANKIFDTRNKSLNDYIGEVIEYSSNRNPFKLVAIIEDQPKNSSLQFNVLLSRESHYSWWGEDSRYTWNGSDYFNYVMLKEGVNSKDFEAKLEAFSNKYFRGNEVTGNFEKFHLQSIEDVHLDQSYEYENHVTADGRIVDILLIIAGFILLMAWVNYINLTTSKALHRAKEVGMRKVVGASVGQLRAQFLLESFVVNFFSLLLAITIVQVFQTFFNKLAGLEFSLLETLLIPFAGVSFVLWLVIFFIVGSLISGAYPAFILSRFKPSQTLKGTFSRQRSGQRVRKSLVIFQFVLSTSLIAFTAIISGQTDYMRNFDIGFDADQVITVAGPQITRLDTTFLSHIHSFLNELERSALIQKVGTSTSEFGDRLPRTFNVRRAGDEKGIMLNRMAMNYGFLDVYGIDLLAGRTFRPSDHKTNDREVNTILLNEKAALLLGFESADDALNKKLTFFGRDFSIIGVTSDFHYRSVKQTVEPLLLVPFYWIQGDTYHIRYKASNTQEVIEKVASVYDQFYPKDVFAYGFANAQVQAQYIEEERFGKVFNVFAFIGIVIACLGLIGLVGFSASQRIKEIGVRKVLGAKVIDILGLVSKDFIIMVLIANLVAIPFIFFGSDRWLSTFENRIDIGLWYFLVPTVIVFLMSIMIVVGQAYKTAQANPVNALRQD